MLCIIPDGSDLQVAVSKMCPMKHRVRKHFSGNLKSSVLFVDCGYVDPQYPQVCYESSKRGSGITFLTLWVFILFLNALKDFRYFQSLLYYENFSICSQPISRFCNLYYFLHCQVEFTAFMFHSTIQNIPNYCYSQFYT